MLLCIRPQVRGMMVHISCMHKDYFDLKGKKLDVCILKYAHQYAYINVSIYINVLVTGYQYKVATSSNNIYYDFLSVYLYTFFLCMGLLVDVYVSTSITAVYYHICYLPCVILWLINFHHHWISLMSTPWNKFSTVLTAYVYTIK